MSEEQNKTAKGFDILEVSKENLLETVENLKTDVNAQFDVLISVSGVDKSECFEVVYHLFSSITNKNIVLKVKLDKKNPVVDTLSNVFSAANWHERETYDLFGIEFNGHPNLERILLPKDWIGHPLRKDYVEKDERLSWNKR